MATFVENTKEHSVLTWPDVYGGTSQAVVDNGVLISLTVAGSTGASIIYSVDQAELSNLSIVLNDLLSFLTP